MKFTKCLVSLAILFAISEVSSLPTGEKKKATNGSPMLAFFEEMGWDKLDKKRPNQGSAGRGIQQIKEVLVEGVTQLLDFYTQFRAENPGQRHISSLWEMLAPEYQFYITRPAQYIFYSSKLPYWRAQQFCLERHGQLPELHTYE